MARNSRMPATRMPAMTRDEIIEELARVMWNSSRGGFREWDELNSRIKLAYITGNVEPVMDYLESHELVKVDDE